ncbi:MAG: 50S ribosomal protein L11 methyltransferase [Saprospiraceae bacterium]|jgi:ribosomal protein L11 methyltransferase|nr:50S ribosomal protein L11 methyltransferase [Saprospiraceae bacterium]MBP8213284.1 50S ribosomal protein L11 methyltransferase [Saprospiraceae bacterium]HMT52965.1 50S ribosomal protein L11 methyltransferase [Saprospiraceae bacterium]HMT70388.1 50S ribosomal protein L11 methyltransferase [Saprospiraceae bacterium]
MEIYLAYTVKSTDEVLMALLTQFEFESFEEHEDHFIGYIKKDDLTAADQDEIISIITRFTDDYKIDDIEPQNWNAIWEASFQPVEVGDFCQIRADFHPKSADVRYDLVINPKMAFGTGHHATTHMVISFMEQIDFQKKTVFDFGCGTGILAILASKLGAEKIDALDIEHESYMNTIENASINGVNNISVFEGDLSVMPASSYDVILANINRNILIRYAAELSQMLVNGGQLLLSGVLAEDSKSVIETYQTYGIQLVDSKEMDGWMSAYLTKLV